LQNGGLTHQPGFCSGHGAAVFKTADFRLLEIKCALSDVFPSATIKFSKNREAKNYPLINIRE